MNKKKMGRWNHVLKNIISIKVLMLKKLDLIVNSGV